ncbi:MAG TPA: DUF4209 domain-containing protein [Candidatus Brocadiia bacterium]|nr:DUF4209 domain-containing protein [Candidatus Brocadiales bacterium]
MLDIKDEKILEIVRDIEDTAQNFEHLHQISRTIAPAIGRAKEIEDKETEQKLIWEHQLFDFMTDTEAGKPEKDKRFYPKATFVTENGKTINVPEITDFKDDSIEYFKKRTHETKNTVLKARYSDFVWEIKKDPSFGKVAVDCYLELLEDYYQKTWFFRLADAFYRIIYLSMLKVVNDAKFRIIKEKLFDYLDKMIKDGHHRFCLELLDAFTHIKKERTIDDEYNKALSISQQCAQHFRKAQNFYLERSFLEIEEKLNSIYSHADLFRMTRERRAQSFVDEALFREEKNDFLAAAIIYQDALKIYQQLGDREKINLYKNKLTEANKKSVKGFKRVSIETRIPNEEIEKLTDIILIAPNLNEALIRLVFDDLLPNYQDLVKQTEDMKTTNPLQFLVNTQVIDKEGHLLSVDKDPSYSILIRNSMLHIKFKTILINRIIERLIQEKGLNKDNLILYLKNWGLIDDNNLKIIEHGIERYFAEDYISSMCILVPQLEAVIRSLLKKGGIQTISFERGTTSTQESNLSELLERPEVREIFGETLHWYIKLVSVEKLGLNLRNDIAHGLIEFEKCNLSNTNIILHIFILLTRYTASHTKDAV